MSPDRKSRLAARDELRKLVTAGLQARGYHGVKVDVDCWLSWSDALTREEVEQWQEPLYITAEARHDETGYPEPELYDAVCDLVPSRLAATATDVVEQLVNG